MLVTVVMIAAAVWMLMIIADSLNVNAGKSPGVTVTTEPPPVKPEAARAIAVLKEESTLQVNPPVEGDRYLVAKVVDGDTIDVIRNGVKQRVRLIGINTPETVDPRKPKECFGPEASSKAKEVLTGKNVILKNDLTQDDKDKYGRILRYVFLEDGTNFNGYMVSEGFAYEYTYKKPYQFRNEFLKDEQEAKNLKKGLWSELTCNGRP